jgi:hypothetical protein
MIIAFVQFKLPAPMTQAEATKLFEKSAANYRHLPGLIRKHYVLSDDGLMAGGMYFWESRAAAEQAFCGEWRERVRALYHSDPAISWFISPVTVDNADRLVGAG